MYSAWFYLHVFFILVWNNSRQHLVLEYHTKLYLSSKVKTLLLSMTDTRKVIWNWKDVRMFGNACAWLLNMTNASCHSQIWKSPHQLIDTDAQIKWSHSTNNSTCVQCFLCLFCTTGLLCFQSFKILCMLDTLHSQILKILNLSCILKQWHYGTIHVQV